MTRREVTLFIDADAYFPLGNNKPPSVSVHKTHAQCSLDGSPAKLDVALLSNVKDMRTEVHVRKVQLCRQRASVSKGTQRRSGHPSAAADNSGGVFAIRVSMQMHFYLVSYA